MTRSLSEPDPWRPIIAQFYSTCPNEKCGRSMRPGDIIWTKSGVRATCSSCVHGSDSRLHETSKEEAERRFGAMDRINQLLHLPEPRSPECWKELGTNVSLLIPHSSVPAVRRYLNRVFKELDWDLTL